MQVVRQRNFDGGAGHKPVGGVLGAALIHARIVLEDCIGCALTPATQPVQSAGEIIPIICLIDTHRR